MTIEDALTEKSVHEAWRLHSEYRVSVGELTQQVRIRIWKGCKGASNYCYTQSHYVHTPLQAGPYRSNAIFADDEASALQLAVRSLTTFYDEAVGANRQPDDSWLVPNNYF